MTNYNEAADLLKGFSEKLRPLTLVADALDEIGNLDAALKSRKDAHEAAKVEYEATLKQVETAKADLAATRGQLAKERDDHAKQIKSFTDDANVQAARVVADAKEKATATVRSAAEEVKAINDKHTAAMAEARKHLMELHEQTKAAKAEHEEIIGHHARISKDVAALREVASRIV